MSRTILDGDIEPEEVELPLEVFNRAILTLVKAKVSYEVILCGMSSALAILADPENRLDYEAMDLVMDAVKDIIALINDKLPSDQPSPGEFGDDVDTDSEAQS